MPKTPASLSHLHASDLRAAAQLAATATHSITRMAEGVNQAVWSTLGAPSGAAADQTRGITGLVFKSVQGITALVGKSVDAALAKLAPYIDKPHSESTPEREAVLAALNGVLGDHLAASGNALATPMTMRYQGQPLDWQAMPSQSAVTGKVVLLVHGLCMNDLQWRTMDAQGTVVDHGAALVALGYTPVYLRYNTGLHTSVNGRALAAQLEQLVQHWPVPISDLSMVVHSMGGLVTRSAVAAAQHSALTWPQHLKNMVFLGTPHHGAPLEKAGHWVDIVLGSTPYSAPFAKLGQLRSAGITDLRYGFVQDQDWLGQSRFSRQPDKRQPLPLPSGVACFTVAGTTAAKRSALAERLIGDGLVTLPSALGQQPGTAHDLHFHKLRQHIAYRTNHMQLLSSPQVGAQIVQWLSADQ